MVKVGIIEDTEDDANRRYGSLNESPHEVHVLMVDVPERFRSGAAYMLENEGKFNPQRIYFDPKNMPPMDIYFCDGLRGRCFGMADRFGKDKTFINTSDGGIEKIARERGYKILEVPIKDLLNKEGSY